MRYFLKLRPLLYLGCGCYYIKLHALLYLDCMRYYIKLHALLYLGCVPYSVASKVQILVKSLNFLPSKFVYTVLITFEDFFLYMSKIVGRKNIEQAKVKQCQAQLANNRN